MGGRVRKRAPHSLGRAGSVSIAAVGPPAEGGVLGPEAVELGLGGMSGLGFSAGAIFCRLPALGLRPPGLGPRGQSVPGAGIDEPEVLPVGFEQQVELATAKPAVGRPHRSVLPARQAVSLEPGG